MRRSWVLAGLVWTVVFFLHGCGGCGDETGEVCPFDECTPCEGHHECAGETFCDDDLGYCAPRLCDPGERTCENATIMTCTEVGDGFSATETCPSGVCTDGTCGCSGPEDCQDAEECVGGVCQCPSALVCAGTCCAEGDSCDSFELCDDDDGCEIVSLCRPDCEGSVCGLQGELCCEGTTPACGPTGQCAPTCEGLGDLCGEDFDQCCPTGDICVFGECRSPGAPCDSFSDCDWGEYCDQGLGVCMPDDFPEDIECRIDGDFEELDVQLKWSWEDDGIISIPVVGDVTGDGEPNVVINTTQVGNWTVGDIVILDGAGQEIRRITHDPDNDQWGSQGRSNIALADITGDGTMEIIYASRVISGGRNYIVAINGDGETLWRAVDEEGDPVLVNVSNGAITVANFNDDPTRAEIVVGAMLIDSQGRVVWNEDGNGPAFGTNSGYHGGVAVVADLTGDGSHEIITGRHAWSVDWQPSADPEAWPDVTVTSLWTHDGPDGYPAVADFDGNGRPEVVLAAAGTVRILDGLSGELWCGVDPSGVICDGDPSARTQPVTLPGPASQNRGGPPTVADFDGDGRPEIGVAGGHYYAVFDIYRPGFGSDLTPEEIDTDLLDQFEQPMPEEGGIFIRWMHATQDLSSNATGSSVFDFQGDGSASVIYSDECFVRVYSGVDGEVELEIMNSTGTILEYPLVVDVDNNGRSEFVVVANDIDHCSGLFDGYETRQGIFVYEDPNDQWVRTRSIWNQHAYSIDNILDSGAVPSVQAESWTTHNTFRANRQGEVPLNAPDVVVTAVQANALACPTDITFQVTVQNQGISGIPAGLPVSLYDLDRDTLLQTVEVEEAIAPGGTVLVYFAYPVPPTLYNRDLNFLVVANDDGEGAPFLDCDPDTASATIHDVRCTYAL